MSYKLIGMTIMAILTTAAIVGILPVFAANNPYLTCPDCNDTSNIQQIPSTSHHTPYLGCPDCNSTSNIQQIQLTSGGTLQVELSTDPVNPTTTSQTQLQINFMNKQDSIQQHIDYKVSIIQGSNQLFGTPLTHTALGSVSIPIKFQNSGTYQIIVEVDGILFQPIPPETAMFSISATGNSQNSSTPNNSTGNSNNPYAHTQNQTTSTTIPTTSAKIPNWVKAVFGYYAQGNLSDTDLINALQFLIQQGIIKLS